MWRTTRRRTAPPLWPPYFNPRPPCGGRRYTIFGVVIPVNNFNPRPPCGGRRGVVRKIVVMARISIHVLHVEDDSAVESTQQSVSISIHVLHVEDDEAPFFAVKLHQHFNPRPPCGGRPHKRPRNRSSAKFQSTSSMWRTTSLYDWQNNSILFQSTSSMWRTTRKAQYNTA